MGCCDRNGYEVLGRVISFIWEMVKWESPLGRGRGYLFVSFLLSIR